MKYDPQYALRLCTEHKQTRACVLIYAAMGLYEESVDHALSVSEDILYMQLVIHGADKGQSAQNSCPLFAWFALRTPYSHVHVVKCCIAQ